MQELSQPSFVPEIVHSTIPVALAKAQLQLIREAGGGDNEYGQQEDLSPRNVSGEERIEPMAVKIAWHGGGKIVILARAGDDDWKGRVPMEREYVYVLRF